MPRWTILVLLAWVGAGCRPGRPVLEEVAAFDTKGWAHDVVPDASRLFVADRQGGFAVFRRDRGWNAPRVFAPVADVISLAPNQGRPVLAARFEGLVRVDEDGRITGRASLGEIANAVAVRDGFAFAAYGAHGLVVARLLDGDLDVVAELPSPGWAHDVKLRGHYAHVASWNYGLQVVDVRDPAKPVAAGRLPTPATAISVAFADDPSLLAVAEGHAGVSLVRVDASGRPARIGHHGLGLDPVSAPHPEAGGWAHAVAWSGRHIFVADWKEGLVVLDAADPTRPQVVLARKTPGTALGVAAERQPDGTVLVFLADGEAGLRVFRLIPQFALRGSR